MEEAMGKRETQVREQLEHLHKAIETLGNCSGQLLDRLGGVTRSTNPQIEKELTGNKVEDAIVPLADEIRANRYRVEAVNRSINDAINRLEL